MLSINSIKAFSDNYIWAIESKNTDSVAIVDPGDAAPVLNYLQTINKPLSAVLVTHHHYDHVGGIDELKQHFPDAIVYGPVNCNYPSIDVELKHGENCSVFDCTFDIVEVPGHTLDHIAYYSSSEEILFCGDTLFAGGCGRVFEGTHQQMHQSLLKLANLPAATKGYCAHEYTMANLKFALSVEPNNQELITRMKYCAELRENNIATVPFTIADELASNPFLRANDSDEFSHRRDLKDNF